MAMPSIDNSVWFGYNRRTLAGKVKTSKYWDGSTVESIMVYTDIPWLLMDMLPN